MSKGPHQALAEVEAQIKQEGEAAAAAQELEKATITSNISLVKAEVDNKKIDNKRQLLQAQDESNRKWAEIMIKASKDGAPEPDAQLLDFESLYEDTEAKEKQEAQQAEEQAQLEQQQMQQMQEQQ